MQARLAALTLLLAACARPVATTKASAHYDVRSSDGDITQQVHDADEAWHAGNGDVNRRSIGIEHEGFSHTGAQWYTDAMYRSSAALVRFICDTNGIPKDRAHIIGHDEVPDPSVAGYFGGASNHHDPCDAWAGAPTWHNNVACYWDWTKYMALVTGGRGAATGVLTGFVGDACCGLSAATRKPLAGASVSVGGAMAIVDATGTYSFTLTAGSYTPLASQTGYVAGDHSSLGGGYPAALPVAAGQTTWGSILLHPVAAAPPVVRISSPAEGAVAKASPVQLRGTVSDAAVKSVTIAGLAFDASSGAWGGTAALAAGANAIVVTAANAAGTGSAAVHVSYAPPSTGVQGTVRASSGAPVAAAAVTAQPGGVRAISDVAGHYQLPLAPGSYTVTTDASGYLVRSIAAQVPADRLLTLDLALAVAAGPQPPRVRIDEPREGAVVGADRVTVAGVAEVQHLASLTIAGETVSVDASQQFSAEVALQVGANTIAVAATAQDGATAQSQVTVDYAPAAIAAKGCSTFPLDGALPLLPAVLFARRRPRQGGAR